MPIACPMPNWVPWAMSSCCQHLLFTLDTSLGYQHKIHTLVGPEVHAEA